MGGTEAGGRTPTQLLSAPLGTRGPTTPKPDKSLLVNLVDPARTQPHDALRAGYRHVYPIERAALVLPDDLGVVLKDALPDLPDQVGMMEAAETRRGSDGPRLAAATRVIAVQDIVPDLPLR